MNRTKLVFKAIMPMIVIFLASCGGTTDREWSIENHSSTTIEFVFKKHNYPYTIQGTLDKGEKRIVEITIEEKADLDPQIPYDVFSDLLITNANGESMKKEWQDNNNWEIYIEETETSPSKQLQTYKLIVEDQDF